MFELVAGLDEAGRGSLAGPVVAAAIVLSPKKPINGLVDSKRLSAKKRLFLYKEIKRKAIAWGIGQAAAAEIDAMNIHQATLLAMQRAYIAMRFKVKHVLVDGLHCPKLSINCTAIVKGDATIPVISAASIVAKVTRDAEMERHHKTLPQYQFNQHKGYPTAQHIAALREFGACILHRKSYKPVKETMTSQAATPGG